MAATEDDMTDKINDGGPAFPSSDYGQFGMDLRDYFAAQTLVGLLGGRGGPIQKQFMADEAVIAYGYADAMIAARDVRAKPAPTEKTVVLYGRLSEGCGWIFGDRDGLDTHTLTFTERDGEPVGPGTIERIEGCL